MTLLASLGVHLIVEYIWESSLVHHLMVNGEGLVYSTLATTEVLIAVLGWLSWSLKSSRSKISIGVGSLLRSGVRYLHNLFQLTCCQLSFGVSRLCSIEVLSYCYWKVIH